MKTLREIAILNEITKPVGKGELPSIVPLLEHLNSTAALSLDFRKSLADMLNPAGRTVYWLPIRRRDNRRVQTKFEVERDAAAYRIVVQLTGHAPTEDICKDIVDAVPRWTFERTNGCVTFFEGRTVAYTQPAKVFSRRAATLLAASAFNMPFETLKQTIARIESAVDA